MSEQPEAYTAGQVVREQTRQDFAEVGCTFSDEAWSRFEAQRQSIRSLLQWQEKALIRELRQSKEVERLRRMEEGLLIALDRIVVRAREMGNAELAQMAYDGMVTNWSAPSEPAISFHIIGAHLMPVETLEALARLAQAVHDQYAAGWRPGETGDPKP